MHWPTNKNRFSTQYLLSTAWEEWTIPSMLQPVLHLFYLLTVRAGFNYSSSAVYRWLFSNTLPIFSFITVVFVTFWTRVTSMFSATLLMLMTRVSKHGAFYPLWDGNRMLKTSSVCVDVSLKYIWGTNAHDSSDEPGCYCSPLRMETSNNSRNDEWIILAPAATVTAFVSLVTG